MLELIKLSKIGCGNITKMVMTVDGKPKHQDVAHWHWDSWDDLTDTMILNNWRHFGITSGLGVGVESVSNEERADDGVDMDDPLELLDMEVDNQSDDNINSRDNE
jgi:hypothetical protein